ncbi:Gldg family protein [bacterium]|nr:Gldg family protein [bacterium]
MSSGSSSKRTLLSISGIILAIAIFIVANGLSRQVLHSWYLDLTDQNLYSLSAGSKKILAELQDPITLRFYYSKTDGARYPSLQLYASRVLELLREYQRLSQGNLKLEIYDPRPDTDEESWAEKYGLTPISMPAGDAIYFGLSGANGIGKESTIPLFNLGRQELLEYDISKLVYELSRASKPVVGILSPLKIQSAASQIPGQPQAPQQWTFISQLKSLAEVKFLDTTSGVIESGFDVVVLIHPRNLSNQTLFAIDQYLLNGGKLLVLEDPYCEADQADPEQAAQPDQQSTQGSSQLNQLLKNWGVELVEDKFVADVNLATRVSTGQGGVKDFVAWLNIPKDLLSANDPATTSIDSLLFPWAGALKLTAVEGITAEPLIGTTDQAMLVDTRSVKLGGGDPDSLLRSYAAGNEKLNIGVRLTGNFKTNFPAGDPAKPEGAEQNQSSSKQAPALKESKKPGTVVVIADVDFISDRYSLITQNVFGRSLVSLLNHNLVLLFNAIDQLTGSTDLITIRSRGKFSRPFERVQQIEINAQRRWQMEEQSLQADLNAANERLRTLEQNEHGEKPAAQQVFSDAVLDEIKQFKEQRRQAQERLREVRKNLREDKERLGTVLFLINTFLVPLVLLVVAVGKLIAKLRTKQRSN